MVASELAQYVVTGLLVGGVYALMSIGLALIFGVMRVVNFAQGDFMMLGMYLTFYYAVALGIDPLLGALLTIPPFFVLGLLVHRAFLARVTGGGDPEPRDGRPAHPHPRPVARHHQRDDDDPLADAALHQRAYASKAFAVGPLLLNQARTYSFAIALLLAGAVYVFLTRTDLGKALRAAADDPEAAGYQGINVRTMHGVAFGDRHRAGGGGGRAARVLSPDRAERRGQLHRADVRRGGPGRARQHPGRLRGRAS